MKFLRSICLLLTLVVLLGTVLPAQAEEMELSLPQQFGSSTIDGVMAPAGSKDYKPDAKAAFVYDRATDTVLYAYNPDQRIYPASTTKILTALLALEMGKLTDKVTITKDMLAQVPNDAAVAGLRSGEKVTLEQLLYCLLVPSGNDAAVAIAIKIGGSIEGFAKLMNKRAQELGCSGTNFTSPHGLPDENHYTTARDMARIFLACLENKTFVKVISTSKYKMAATNKADKRTLTNTNRLIVNSKPKELYDQRVVGGKTGYTKAAGRCLITLSRDKGMELVTLVFGAPLWTEQWDGIYSNCVENKELLSYVYDNFSIQQVATKGTEAGELLVSNGDGPVKTAIGEDLLAALPGEPDPQQVTVTTMAAEGLTAPIQAGQTVGTAQVWYQGRCLGECSLVALNDVQIPTEPPTEPPKEPSTEPSTDSQTPTENATQPSRQPVPQKTPAAVWIPALAAVVLMAAVAAIVMILKKSKR